MNEKLSKQKNVWMKQMQQSKMLTLLLLYVVQRLTIFTRNNAID